MIQVPDCVPSAPVDVAARSPTPLIVAGVSPPPSCSVLNSSVQAALLPALGVTVTSMAPEAYKHELPPAPKEAVAVVYVAPVIDDACAAVSSEQTLTPDDAPVLAAPVTVLGVALAAAAGDGADVVGAAADVLDRFEQAVADMVTSTTLAAAKTVVNRMTSPSLGRSTVAGATER